MTPTSRQNKIFGFTAFLQAWSTPDHPANRLPVEFQYTEYGSINMSGKPDNLGHLLTRWHPQFAASLEEGVRDLVLLITEKFDWITYSCCEGHLFDSLPLRPTPRTVGIVARDAAEAKIIETTLLSVADSVNQDQKNSHVEVLTLALSEGDVSYDAVDLIFHRFRSQSWNEYFATVDDVTRLFIDRLQRCRTSPNPA